MNRQLSQGSLERAKHRLPTPSTLTLRRLQTMMSHSTMSVSSKESMIFSSRLPDRRQKPSRKRESKTTGPPMRDKFQRLFHQEIKESLSTSFEHDHAKNKEKRFKLKLKIGLFT